MPVVVTPPKTKYEMTDEMSPPVTPQIAPQSTAIGAEPKAPRRVAAHATIAMSTWIGAKASHIICPLVSAVSPWLVSPVTIPTTGPASAVAVTVPTVSRNTGSASSATTRPSTTFSATQVGMRARLRGFIGEGKGRSKGSRDRGLGGGSRPPTKSQLKGEDFSAGTPKPRRPQYPD